MLESVGLMNQALRINENDTYQGTEFTGVRHWYHILLA